MASQRLSLAEKRALERAVSDVYNDVRQAAEAHRWAAGRGGGRGGGRCVCACVCESVKGVRGGKSLVLGLRHVCVPCLPNRQTRKYIQRWLQPGMRLIDVCEHLEETARTLVGANKLQAGQWGGGGGRGGGGWW